MAYSVTLPELGESVTEGTVTRWLKQVGDSVAVDEPLLEISTDKVDTEVPSPVAGTVLEIRAGEDETVEVGGVLAVIGDANAAPQAAPAPAPAAPPPPPAPAPTPAPPPAPVQETKPAPPAAPPAPRHPPPRRRRRATVPPKARTSRRWCGSWRPSTASTSRR